MEKSLYCIEYDITGLWKYADNFDVFSMKWMRHIKYQENENVHNVMYINSGKTWGIAQWW